MTALSSTTLPSHMWLSFDWAAAELYLLALFAQDERLRHNLDTGDVHSSTIADMYGIPLPEVTSKQRDLAKVINYALPYSGFDFDSTVSNILKKAPETTKAQATASLERYVANYQRTFDWSREALFDWYDAEGWVAYLYGQRKRILFPDYTKRQESTLRRSQEGRVALNTYGQNSVGLLLKLCLARVRQDPFLREHLRQPLPVFDACSWLIPTVHLAEIQRRLHAIFTPVLSCNGFSVRMRTDWKASLTSWGELRKLPTPTGSNAEPWTLAWEAKPLAPAPMALDANPFNPFENANVA